MPRDPAAHCGLELCDNIKRKLGTDRCKPFNKGSIDLLSAGREGEPDRQMGG